ncbi:MAG: anti-CBASS protein Acb1 family protein [Alphaproteobacteria bacterium]
MTDLILPSNTTRTDDLAALRTLAAGGTIGAMNYATGMGMPMYDPSRHADMGTGVIPLDRGQQDRLMRSHKFIRKIIETIPNQMTYRWGNLTLGGDDGAPDIINDVHTWLDNLNTKSLVNRYKGLKRAFNQAIKMAFQTGNAALVILAKDGQNFDRPINSNNLRSIEGLFLADRWSIQPDISGIYANLEMAEYFWLNDSRFNKIIQLRGGDLGRIRIHRSRVLWFRGEELSDRTLLENEGCDDSVLQGIQQSFQEYFQAIRGAGRMIVDFDVVVHKVSGLLARIDNDPSGQYQQKMMERAQINNICRSIWRSMLIDLEDEDIVHSTRNVSGYDSLLDRLVLDLQANTDLTKSELFNEMSKGLSATDKVEQENANNRTRMYQESKLDSNMYDFLKLVFACKDGPTQGKEPDKWEWKWQELYPVTPVEQAELELMRSQIDQINSSIGAYTGEEAAKSHYSGSEYNPEITINWKEREKLKAEQEKQQAEADKLAIQMGLLPGMEQPLLPGQPKQRALPGQQPKKALPGAKEVTDSDDPFTPKTEGFWPPLQVQAIARKGLDLFKQYGSPGKPNIMQSVFFARHMAYGQQIPRNAVFFIKQQNDLMRIPPDGDNPKHPSYEFIAYLCRGGAAGQVWVEQMVKEIEQLDSASIPSPDNVSIKDPIVVDSEEAPRADDDTPIKKAIAFHNYQIGLQYQPMDERHGKILPVGYGEFLGIISEHDAMNIDVYVGPDLSSRRVFAITQLDRKTGEFDEVKFFVGCDRTPEEIAKLYQAIMTPEHFGGIEEIPMEMIPSYQPQPWMVKTPVTGDIPDLPRSDAEDDVLSEQDYAQMLDDLPLDAIDPLVDWGTGED